MEWNCKALQGISADINISLPATNSSISQYSGQNSYSRYSTRVNGHKFTTVNQYLVLLSRDLNITGFCSRICQLSVTGIPKKRFEKVFGGQVLGYA